MKQKIKRGCLFTLGVLVLVFLWATFPWDLHPRIEDGLIGQTTAPETAEERPTTLTVLTWNIGYGHGMYSDGTAKYAPHSADKHRLHLDYMAESIRAAEADVVVLQEIDFDSSRTFHQDQLKALAEKTGLKYWARAESWRTNYVPFPTWPFSRQFGSMSSGGAVLSRWPIKRNRVELLAKPTSKAWWYNLFYLYRYFQTVEIQVGERKLKLINLHLEAFDRAAKIDQAKLLLKRVGEEKPDLVAGDFNTVPDGAMKRSGFYNPTDRYENDPTFGIITKMPYQEVVQLGAYLSKEELWFTFPSERPDRRLDYIFYREGLTLIKSEVFPGPHPEVSDHLALRATFKYFDPEFIRD